MRIKLFEIVTDKDKIDIENVKKVFAERDCIKDWAYICHDKDNTREHYHITVRLRDGYDTKYIAQWFGIAENFISKVKGRWSDMLKYLIHENAPEKFQYSGDEVVSNFDWKKEKDIKTGDERKEEIMNLIVEGKIREYNYFEYITIEEYNKYRTSIDNAYRYRTDKIKGVSRLMEAVFITGDSGTGKTTYAKLLAEKKGYSVFVSSGSNDVLDDYKGQDCIILDDLRPSSLGLADLLKMLDNHTASTVKSRYKNKVLECKMIVITTTLDIERFFNNVFSEEKETIVQLKRRCKTHVRMELDYMYSSVWIDSTRCYGREFKFPNVVTLQFEMPSMTEEQQLEKLSEMLGLGKEIIDEIKNNDLYKDNMEEVKGGEFPFEQTKL